MPKFRKKPVVIEAMLFGPANSVGWVSAEIADEILKWSGSEVRLASYDPKTNTTDVLTIITLEGTMYAQPGDWIIKGVQGEFYPCKPDIFEATYEAVVEESAPKTQEEKIEFRKNWDDKVIEDGKFGLTKTGDWRVGNA